MRTILIPSTIHIPVFILSSIDKISLSFILHFSKELLITWEKQVSNLLPELQWFQLIGGLSCWIGSHKRVDEELGKKDIWEKVNWAGEDILSKNKNISLNTLDYKYTVAGELQNKVVFWRKTTWTVLICDINIEFVQEQNSSRNKNTPLSYWSMEAAWSSWFNSCQS